MFRSLHLRELTKWSIALLILCISCSEGVAQRLHIINKSVAEGLSQSEVSDIVELRDGRIMFNTGGLGVDIYDGRRFTPFLDFPHLESRFINSVLVTDDGEVWCISLRGMQRMEGDSTSAIIFGDSSKGVSSIFSSVQLDENEYLIGTDDGLIWIKDGEVKPRIGAARGMKVFGLLKTGPRSALLTTQSGVVKWKQGEYESYFDKASPYYNLATYSIARDETGTTYFGAKDGMISISRDEGEVQFIDMDLRASNTVIALIKTKDGRILAGTNGSGLYVYFNGELQSRITEVQGLSDDYVWSLMESVNGDIWVGTSGAGVDVISSPHFSQLTTKEGLSGDVVYAFEEDKDGRVWIGMVQGGITVYDEGDLQLFDAEDGLSHRTVRSMLQEKDTLWIGTENGLTIFVDNQLKDVSDFFGLRNQAIFDMHRSADGMLWFACKGERYFGPNGGAARWDGKELRVYQTNDGLIDDNVYFIHEEDNGEMWFGTASGISVWDGESFAVPRTDGLCGTTSICLRKDKWGTRWVGTIGGLTVLEEGNNRCLSQGDHLKARTIYFLEIQGDSLLWIGSSEGLEKLNLNNYHKDGSLAVTHYDDQTGFVGTEANQNAVLKHSDGSIWFGTIEGAVRYDPSKDAGNRSLGKAAIRSFSANGVEIKLEMMSQMDSLSMSHRQNNISIVYDVIDPVAAEGYLFSIRMEGLEDEEWSEFSDQRSVIYTNLTPHEYTFSLRAMSTTTGEVTPIRKVFFEVVPAIWQRGWFKFLMAALFVFGVISFFVWRLKQIDLRQKQQQEFQHQLHEVEMTALRAQMNPHFLFNSLNSVNHFIIKNERMEASAYLTKFARLVRLVLLNSEKKTVSLENEFDALKLYIELEQLRFSSAFEVKIDIDPAINLGNVQIPPLLLQPYVENAIWHGLLHLEERKGQLTLSVDGDAEQLRIEIEDNGVGRARAKELKSRSASKKKSMGMKINSDRVRLTEELYGYRTTVRVTDKHDDDGKGIGTLVQLELIYNDKENTSGNRRR